LRIKIIFFVELAKMVKMNEYFQDFALDNLKNTTECPGMVKDELFRELPRSL